MQGVLGAAFLLALAFALSEDRAAARGGAGIRLVGAGVALHAGLAFLLLKIPAAQDVFLALNGVVAALDEATRAGTSFVFGYLGGGPTPFEVEHAEFNAVLAFRYLPLVLVISALSALLFHWRILPWIVRGFSILLEKTLGVGGALGVGAAANIFVGMVEAPLLVRPYLARMRRAELFALMVTGMATIAGTVMVLYATILAPRIDGALGHILTASILNVPAALIMAGMLVPPPRAGSRAPEAEGEAPAAPVLESPASSAMDAVTRGTAEGVKLLLNIAAMLIVLVAFVALVNIVLGVLPDVAGAPIALERVLGWVLAPLTWLMGVPWAEAVTAGQLLGTKIVLNELKAYLDMAALAPDALSGRSRIIMIYALCGFANFGSLGIMIGGLTTLVPDRRAEIVALGLKSILAGVMATCFTGAVVGLLVGP